MGWELPSWASARGHEVSIRWISSLGQLEEIVCDRRSVFATVEPRNAIVSVLVVLFGACNVAFGDGVKVCLKSHGWGESSEV